MRTNNGFGLDQKKQICRYNRPLEPNFPTLLAPGNLLFEILNKHDFLRMSEVALDQFNFKMSPGFGLTVPEDD